MLDSKRKFHENRVKQLIKELQYNIKGLDGSKLADRAKMHTAIKAIVAKASVDAAGKTTVFYAGHINGGDSFLVADAMRHDKNIRVIDKTETFELLDDDDFRDIVASSFGYDDAGDMEKILKEKYKNNPDKNAIYASKERQFMSNPKTGLWGLASKKFAKATTGDVSILTTRPRENSILLTTEVDELLKKIILKYLGLILMKLSHMLLLKNF